jgi:hypothetical protein
MTSRELSTIPEHAPTLRELIAVLSSSVVGKHVWKENIFTEETKECAQNVIDMGVSTPFLQCLANGNLDYPEDVLHVAKKIGKADAQKLKTLKGENHG